jgi:hypothetical protein
MTIKIWIFFLRFEVSLTCDNESVDCDSVVFVFLVGVGAPEAETGAESSEEVGHDADDHQSGDAANVA